MNTTYQLIDVVNILPDTTTLIVIKINVYGR